MSRTSPDVLSPCGGHQPQALGGCWQQYATSSLSHSVWVNTTKVVDYNTIATYNPNGIAPYERPYSVRDQTCFCGGFSCPHGGDDCQALTNGYGTGIASENEPTTCSVFACSQSNYQVIESIYRNCYAVTPESVNFAKCRHRGFKSLASKKIYQGKSAYTCRDLDTVGFWDSFDYCFNTCGWHFYDSASQDTTHYLHLSASAQWHQDNLGYGDTFDWDANANATCDVNKYSGATTTTEWSQSVIRSGTPDPALITAYAQQMLFLANGDANTLKDIYLSWYSVIEPYSPTVTQHSANSYTLEWNDISGDFIALFIDMAAFSVVYSSEIGNGGSDGVTTTYEEVEYTATTVTRTYTVSNTHIIAGGTTSETCTAQLSNPYTTTELFQDLIDMLSNYFNIGSETMYPWRYQSSENTVKAPMVTRDEVKGTVSLLSDGLDQYNWKVTGNILGRPSGVRTAAYWDHKHEAYQNCTSIYKLRGYGGWSGQGGIPNAATKWTNALEENTIMTQGAFVYFSGDTLYGQIDAQALERYPGYSWIRPCGVYDRFILSGSYPSSYDTKLSNCINHFTESSVVLDTHSYPNNIAVPCTASIWGASTAFNGVWIVNGNASGTCSLVKLLVSGSDLPSDLYGYAADTDFGNGMICRNQWIASTPGICGRVDITSITKATPITMSLMEPQQGIINDDLMYIKGCAGASGLNNKIWRMIPLGSPYLSFALSGSTTSSLGTPYTSSGYIEVPFSIDWKWNSETSRQQYVIASYFDPKFRERGEYARLIALSASNAGGFKCDTVTPCYIGALLPASVTPQIVFTQSCLPSNACSPNVVSIMPSPNSHSFAYSQNHTFKTDLAHLIDTKYPGMVWQSWIVQSINDPLGLYNPPCPCREILNEAEEVIGYDCDCQWNEDTTCAGKQDPIPPLVPCQDYFAHAPQFEAVCTPPSDAPFLPQGASLTAGIARPGVGALLYTPWWDMMARETCVCNNDRFSIYYARNRVTCPDDEPDI